MSLDQLDVMFIRPFLCLTGVICAVWIYRIWPLMSLRVLMIIGIVVGVIDSVGQFVDAGVLVMEADERMQLYYVWGLLGLASLPFWVSFLLSLRRLIRAQQQPQSNTPV